MYIQQLLDRGYTVKTYNKDEVVYALGMKPRFVYFIKSGEVRMITVNEDGKEFIQGIFKQGEYFGEPALLVDKPYLAYTIVTKTSELIEVNKESFFSFLKDNPEFTNDLIKVLSNRLFYKAMMLEELANEKAEHRLQTIINFLFKDLQNGDILQVTRRDLAELTGLRVETVIRLVKQMAKNGSLELVKGKIIKR